MPQTLVKLCSGNSIVMFDADYGQKYHRPETVYSSILFVRTPTKRELQCKDLPQKEHHKATRKPAEIKKALSCDSALCCL